jgi:hypothetical protein
MPRKLNAELHDRIVEIVRQGNYERTACRATKTSWRTYVDWKARGKAALDLMDSGEPVPESEQAFLDLYLDVEKAGAEAEIDALQNMQASGVNGNKDQWTKWMTYLERRKPEEWKSRTVIETEEKSADPVADVIAKIPTMPRAELEELLSSLQAQMKPHLKVVNG